MNQNKNNLVCIADQDQGIASAEMHSNQSDTRITPSQKIKNSERSEKSRKTMSNPTVRNVNFNATTIKKEI